MSANATISINEVMPCNLSTIVNTDNYNFSGYIEIANTDLATNLNGYTLVHYKKGSNGYSEKWTWEIDSDVIAETGYTLLWADESTDANHIPFKLDTDGGYLVLKNNGTVVDSLSYEKMTAHIAYGRFNGKQGYMLPSPASDNSICYGSLSRCTAPLFNVKGGLKTSAFELTMGCATSNAAIYYTTNGKAPDATSTPYTGPITIDKNTNIRAIAYSADRLPSVLSTQSYIFPDADHDCGDITLPIVSITVDSLYFFDKKMGMTVVGTNGILGEKSCTRIKANYNRDWKRPVNFEYFVNGEQVLSQEVEAAVEGGCSRTEKIKSLSLKASKKSGKDGYDYHFFQSKPDVTHQTIHLRNGGTAYSKVKFRDGLMQTFATGMNIDYQAYQPVAYYRNGKYIGLMALNERTNADYVKANYGIDEEDLDLITLSDQLGIRASKGDRTAYDNMVRYISTTDASNPEYFAEVSKMMDMDEYIDYQIFQQFIVNTDWPGNNTKIWRERKDDARFRWILFDTDFGFGLPGYEYLGTATKNMIDWCRGAGGVQWANSKSWMTIIFRNLCNNYEFKRRFVTKYFIELSTTFHEDHINAVFDSITALVSNEYCANEGTDAVAATAKMRKFALDRTLYVPTHLKNFADGGSVINFSLASNIPGAKFTFNGIAVDQFNGKYITGFNTEIQAYPPVGYSFDHWEYSNSGSFSKIAEETATKSNLCGKLSGTLSGDLGLVAVFVPSASEPTLVINEICASSNADSKNADDYGKYPDWIEVYNYGNQPVDLAGFYLSNTNTNLLKSQIGYGSDKTIVNPGEHKIIWAKGNSVDGPMYLSFNLNVDKPKFVVLSNTDGSFVSMAYYGSQLPNESFGYEMDNSGEWVKFSTVDGNINATPGAANKMTITVVEPMASNSEESVLYMYPNPAQDRVSITCTDEISLVELCDVKGRMVKQVRPLDKHTELDLDGCSKGIYVVKVTSQGNSFVKKLVVE